MKKLFLSTILFLLMMSGMAQAKLTTIGTVSYDSNNDGTGETYNLIFEGELGSNGLVWLDYTNGGTNWATQVAWAQGLSFSSADVTIDSAYATSIDWATGWRLPETVDDPYKYGYDGTTTAGYNITTSEMGHLFYEELGNLGKYDKNGDYQSGYGLQKTGDFENLNASLYWSGTENANYTSTAWHFSMRYGDQNTNVKTNYGYGLAVLSGQVSAVPVPGTAWLLGIGVAGLAGLVRSKSRNCG